MDLNVGENGKEKISLVFRWILRFVFWLKIKGKFFYSRIPLSYFIFQKNYNNNINYDSVSSGMLLDRHIGECILHQSYHSMRSAYHKKFGNELLSLKTQNFSEFYHSVRVSRRQAKHFSRLAFPLG